LGVEFSYIIWQSRPLEASSFPGNRYSAAATGAACPSAVLLAVKRKI